MTQDKTRIDDTRIAAVRPLMTPALLEEALPASAANLTLVEASRQAVSDVLNNRDDRLVVVVGPCSIHNRPAIRTPSNSIAPVNSEADLPF